jgi:hypothetical protein
MALLDRVKNIIMTPKTEWQVINGETETPQSLLSKYVIPLLLIGTAASFIGYAFIGKGYFLGRIIGIKWGIYFAIQYLVTGILGYYVSTYVVDALAPSFGSEKNLGKSAQLVAYASTPFWVASVFNILPVLSWLTIVGLYAIYLFYIGLPLVKKTPADKTVAYMIVAALVNIVVWFVVGMILAFILTATIGNPYSTGFDDFRDIFKK